MSDTPLTAIADDLDRMEIYERSNPDGASPEANILRAADAVIRLARKYHPEVGRQIADCKDIAKALDAYEAACREKEHG